METAEEHDALGEAGDDPFAAVPADGGDDPLSGPDPELVAPGELGGKDAGEQEQLADPLDEEPLGEGEPPIPPPGPGEALEDPEAGQDDEDDEPEPEPSPEPEPEPAPEPEPESEPTPPADPEPEAPSEEELAADAEAEAKAAEAEAAKKAEAEAAKKAKPKSGGRRRSSAKPKKGERKYVVVQCDKDDTPTGIVYEGNHRTDRDARRAAFDKMEGVLEAHLCAVPERYWNVKTLTAEEETVRKIKEK